MCVGILALVGVVFLIGVVAIAYTLYKDYRLF